MEEIWKDIDSYSNYQVSNMGRVKSLNYKRTGQEKILKLGKDKDGYLQVGLHKDGKTKTFQVHRLVCIAFLDNPDNLPCVNHRDENKENNNVNNLEFCTHEYNNNYGTRTERTRKKVICITTNMVFNSITEAENFYNIKGHRHISSCCKGKSKSAGKYNGVPLVWRYLTIIPL